MTDWTAENARAKTREQVQAALAGAREPREHTCPHCGAVTRTLSETCPECGESFFTRPARFARRQRRALRTAGLALGLVAASAFVVVLLHQSRGNQVRANAERARAVAAERRRLALEQRPHHAQASVVDPRRGTRRVAIRKAMVSELEAAITSDAKARARAG